MDATKELRNELAGISVSDDTTAEIAKIFRDWRKPKFSTRPPSRFVFPVDGTPMEQENAVIAYFYDNWAAKKKNLYNLAKRIYPQVPKFIQRSLLNPVLRYEVDPVDFWVSCFDEKAIWLEIIERMLKEGNHGVIWSKDGSVHGINLNTQPRWLNDKQQKRWHPDDEWAIMKDVVDRWEEEHGTLDGGKVMLFPEFGFSGMPKKL